MPADCSLVRLHVRDHSVYLSRGYSVLATRRDGSLDGGPEQGLFVHQTRLLSRYRCRLDGQAPVPVALSNIGPNAWLGYYIVAAPGHGSAEAGLTAPQEAAQQSIELKVARVIDGGLHEDLDVTNFTQETVSLELTLDIDADFADQEETKGERKQKGRRTRRWRHEDDGDRLTFDYHAEHAYDVQGNRGTATLHRAVELRIAHATSAPTHRNGRITFPIVLSPHATWHACLCWIPIIDGHRLPAPSGCHAFGEQADEADALYLRDATQFEVPSSGTLGAVVVQALQQARRDVLALRLPALDRHPRAWTVAAGLPMYVALFGRDTLTVAWEAALLGPEVMQGTLPELARWQGTQTNDWRDEDPGRMLHEAHTGPTKVLNYNPKARYYGSVTTSGFYPFGAAQLWHWTADKAAVAPYIEPALKALDWLDRATGDSGFLHYRTRSRQGVENQGWKDSGDAIVDADGRQVHAPIATCEEQGIVYAAKLNFAEVLWWFDRREEAKRIFHEAEELKRRFNDAFWMEDEGFLAMALDARNTQVRSIGSNPVHCVATGIVDKALVPRTLSRLFAPDMFSGWGLRTLSAAHPAYNPYSYHRGSVWPVEHGPFVIGAYRYGCHERVEQVCRGMFEAAALFDFCRLPECFSGHARDHDHPFPALYPAANSPQAWSATTVFTLLQGLLGLQPFAPFRMLFVDPCLPEWLPDITLRGLRVRDAVVDLRFFRNDDGASDYEVLRQDGGSLHVVRQPSPWSLTANFGERLKDLVLSAMPGR
jgi:glycogen debranching enzyme